MGKIIDEIALKRGHEVVARLKETPTAENLNNPDVVIEFSLPEVAFDNIKACLENKIPVICGTTGWLERKSEVEQLAVENETAFLYGSNFSLGVNLFFALNEKLADLMKNVDEYSCQLEEIHHIHKLDAPSGTAISLAEGIIKNNNKFDAWKLEETQENLSQRIGRDRSTITNSIRLSR
jgi:4-hydroxy-tetrahydrodipicolinate reductase